MFTSSYLARLYKKKTNKKYNVFQLYTLILYIILNLFISMFRSDNVQCHFCGTGSMGILDVFFSIWRCAYYLKKVNLHLDVYENSAVPKRKLKYRQVHDIMHSYFFALTFLEHFAQTIVNETDSFIPANVYARRSNIFLFLDVMKNIQTPFY